MTRYHFVNYRKRLARTLKWLDEDQKAGRYVRRHNLPSYDLNDARRMKRKERKRRLRAKKR